MCRVLTYLGNPILLEELLYKPDSSFIKQSYHPKYMSYILNLAGFGMAAWEASSTNPAIPFLYKTDQLPFYDDNLRNLTKKIRPNCLLSHIRGVSYVDKQNVSKQNVHPFIFPGSNVAFAHNGSLYEFDRMKYDLLDYIHSDYKKYIQGTTDSEWLYALFISQLPLVPGKLATDTILDALIRTLKILQELRNKYNIRVNSPVNLFFSNGDFIAATRFVFDYGWVPPQNESTMLEHFSYHSLWYTYGENYQYQKNQYKMVGNKIKSSIIIASEPLTEDTTTWIELPEYTCIVARPEEGQISIVTHDINF